MAGIKFDITGDNKNFLNSLNGAQRGVVNAMTAIEQSGMGIEAMFKRMQNAAAASLAGFSAKEFVGKVYEVRSEIEKLETSFRVLVGNKEQADALFSSIRKFAVETPMQLKDLAGAAQTMMGFGIATEDVMANLKALGDISMGDSQKFQSLALAFSQMSATGKLMGQDLLQMINAGFNPLEQMSRTTGKSIAALKEEMAQGAITADMVRQAFMDATSEGGKFNGMLEAQSKTIAGAYSNLRGAIDDMLNEIGQKSQGIMSGAIEAATSLAQNYERVGKVIAGLVGVYGTYKAAVMVYNAIQKAHVTWIGLEQTAHLQNVLATEAEIAAKGKATVATVLLDRASKALHATMLANPYVLVATLIAGVAAALWNMKSQQDLVSDALDEYNRKKEETIAKEKEHADKLNELIGIAGNESLSTDTRREAMLKLKAEYPDLFRKYNTEIEALKDIAYWKAKIAEIESGRSIAGHENELADVNRQIRELEAIHTDWFISTAGKKVYTGRNRTREEEARLTALRQTRDSLISEQKKAADAAYLKDLTGVSNEELKKQIDERRNLIARIAMQEQEGKSNIKGRVVQGGVTGLYSKEELQDQLQTMEWEQNRRKQIIEDGSKDFVQEANKAYAREKTALLQLESLHDPLKRAKSELTIDGKKVKDMGTDEFLAAIEKQQKAVDAAKKKVDAYDKARNGGSSSTSKTDSAAREDASRKQKVFEQELSERQRQAKQKEDMEEALSAAAIASEENRAKRELMQAEKDHKDALAAIDRQAEEMKKANYEAQKKAWEASNTDKTKVWTDTSTAKDVAANGFVNIELTEEQMATLKALREKEDAEDARRVKERFEKERQALLDYMKEYGSIQDQKAAIAEEYDRKIADESNAVQRAALLRQKEQALEELNFREWQQSIDWEAVFNDMERQSTSALESLKEKLRSELTSGNVTAENAKVLAEKIREIEDLLSQRKDPFAAWMPGLRTRLQLTNQIKEAEEKIAGLQATSDKKRADLISLILDESGMSEGAFRQRFGSELAADDFESILQTLAISSDDVTVALTDFKAALEGTTEAQKNAKQRQEALKNFTKDGDIAQYFKDITAGLDFGGIANLVNTNVQSMSDLVDNIGLGSTEFGEGVHEFAEGVGGFNSAIQALASGDVFGALNGIVDGFKGFGRLFGIGVADNSAYEAALDKWGGILDAWEDNVKYERELMEKAYGATAIDYSKQALKALEDAQKAASEIYKGWAASGAGLFSHSHGYEANRDANWNYLWEYDEDLAKQLGVTKGYTVVGEYYEGNISRLFDLTWEQLEKIQNRAPQFWASLTDEAKDYLNNYIEAGRLAAETIDALNEQLTTTTKENVFDDFLNSLYDLADGGEDVMDDIADNWQKMVNRMVINNTIGAEFQKDVEDWYKRLSALQEEYSNGGMKGSDYKAALDGIYSDYTDLVAKAQAKMEDFTKLGIIAPLETASEKAFTQMRDNFLNALTDMNAETRDLMDDFTDTLVSELVDKFVLDEAFTQWMNDWKAQYASIINDENLPEEKRIRLIKALMQDLADKHDELNEKARTWTEAFKTQEDVFSDLGDSFKECILDMERTADDFAASLKTSFRRAITNSFIMTPEVKSQIEEWAKTANELTSPDYKGEAGESLKERYREMKEFFEGYGIWEEDLEKGYEEYQDFLESIGYEPEEIRALWEEYVALVEAVNNLEYSDEERARDIEAHAQALKALYDSVEASQDYWDKILGFASETSPFDDLRDTFLDTLTDIEADAESFRKKLEQALVKDLMEKLVLDVPLTVSIEGEEKLFESFDKYSKDWNGRYLNAVKVLQEARKSGDAEAIAEAQAAVDALLAEVEGVYTELEESADEFRQRLKEIANDSTFTDMADSLVSSLMDAEGDVEDIANDMKKTIVQKLVEAFMVSEQIKPLLEELQATFDAVMGMEGLTASERAQLMKDGFSDSEREYLGIGDEEVTERLAAWQEVVKGIMAAIGYQIEETAGLFDDLGERISSSLSGSGVEDFINGLTESIVDEMTKAYMATDEFKARLEAVKAALLAAAEAVQNASTPEELAAATEQLREAEEAAKGLYNEVDEATKAIRDLNKQLEQDTSFKDMTDSWVSNLMDFNATAEDWAEEIGKTMARRIIEKMIVPTMLQPLLYSVQEAFNAAMTAATSTDADGNTVYDWEAVLGDESLKAALADLQSQYPELKEVVQKILSMAGVKADFSNSLDSLGDTLLDRLLSLDDDVEDIGKQIGSTLIREMLKQMLATGPYADEIARIRQMWQDILTGKNVDEDGNVLYTMADVLQSIEALEGEINGNADISALAEKWKEWEKGAESGFSDLRGTLVSALTDMEGDAGTFGKNIGLTMAEQMLDAYIDKTYKEQIAALNEEWAEALASGDPAKIEAIRQKVLALYATIGDDEAVKQLASDIKELEKELDRTFSDMGDDWASALMDMDSTAEDWGRQIGRSLAQKLVKELVVGKQLQKYLDDIQAAYNEAIGKEGATIQSVLAAVIPKIDAAVAATEEWKPVMDEIAKRFEELDQSTPLDNLRSTFLSQLMDMESDTEDFAKSINEILTQAFIDKFVLGEEFDKRLEEWKKEYGSIMGGNYSEEERASLLKQLRQTIQTAEEGYAAEAAAIHDFMGTASYADQSATMNMADKITYEQADLLLGINMAQEMTLEQILAAINGGGSVSGSGYAMFQQMYGTSHNDDTAKQILTTLQSMSGLLSAGQPDGYGEQIFNRLGTTNDYLRAIRDDVKAYLGNIAMYTANLVKL